MPVTTHPADLELRRHQSAGRTPSIAAAVLRDGEVVWSGAAGRLNGRPDGTPATVDTRYRIGSITKTFVAAATLQLVAEGIVELDAPVVEYLPELAPDLSRTNVRSLLNHSSGLFAETDGHWWERSPGRTWEELRSSIRLNPALVGRFHYSNVGYGVLGELLARLRGKHWFEVVQEGLLAPLGLTRTVYERPEDAAPGLAVHPHADLLHREEVQDTLAMSAAGELWSTVGDLALWARFLARGDEKVLPDELLDTMRAPTVLDATFGRPFARAYGLGLDVSHRDGRWYIGHGGSMPGFLATVTIDPATGDGFTLLTNTTGNLDLHLGFDLLAATTPTAPVEWTATGDVPDADVVGTWYWGPRANTVSIDGEHLVLSPLGVGRGSRFRRTTDGDWVGLDGYYAGELLTVHRTDEATYLDLGSFRYSRTPYDPQSDIPGGVDADGWR